MHVSDSCRCCATLPATTSVASPECVRAGSLGAGQHHRWGIANVNTFTNTTGWQAHVSVLSRWRPTVQRLRDQFGSGQALAVFHLPHHSHHLPAQCHLGHGQPVPPQGPSTTHGNNPGGAWQTQTFNPCLSLKNFKASFDGTLDKSKDWVKDWKSNKSTTKLQIYGPRFIFWTLSDQRAMSVLL